MEERLRELLAEYEASVGSWFSYGADDFSQGQSAGYDQALERVIDDLKVLLDTSRL